MDGFIVLGTINAIAYKEIFPLIKEGKVKTGTVFNKTLQFKAPLGELKNMIGISWFTTFTVENKKPLLLTAKYDPEKYPKYDNYDAIEVGKTKDIPCDYDGIMGVPITFLHKYCPSQFEIIGFFNNYKPQTADVNAGQIYGDAVKIATTKSLFRGPVVAGKATYFRILIKRKETYSRILIRKVKKTVENHGKKFIIIGNGNAVTYKEIFPLIKENKIWYGVTMYGCQQSIFVVPQTYNGKFVSIIDGKRMAQVNNACWFTNVQHKKRNTPITLYKTYSADKYPKYDNYDAIEVSRVENIPCDYDGVMGVPITFLHKYCPSQFEIVKFRKGDDDKDLSVNGKCPYFRILIRKRPDNNIEKQ